MLPKSKAAPQTFASVIRFMLPNLLPLLVLVKSHMAGEPVKGFCNPPHCLLSGEASSSLEKSGLLLSSCIYMTFQLTVRQINGAFSLPTHLLCKLDIRSEGGLCGHMPDFPGSLGFALHIYPDRCMPSSFSAAFQP